jgi:hypothetical protein
MPTPFIGDLIESTVGKVVDRITDKYLPPSMSEKEKTELKLEAQRLAIDEYRTALSDVQGARALAGKESEGAPGWAKVLTVTHRPVWSFCMLGVFVWTVLAQYIGFPGIPLTEIHKEVMQTVIIFYFGGRSIEKAAQTVWGKA